MSRTWKDRPYWVRAQDKENNNRRARHNCGIALPSYQRGESEYRVCDLHEEVDTLAEWWDKNCIFDPDPNWYIYSPSYWAKETVTVPRRRRDRDKAIEAVKIANGGGEIEDFDIGVNEPALPWYW